MRALVDDDRIGNLDGLSILDRENEGHFIRVEISAVQVDAPGAQLVGSELPHTHARLQHVGDGNVHC